MDYYLGFNAQIRKPSAEEEQNPLVVMEATGRAGADEAPAATGQRQIRAVVTIEGLDWATNCHCQRSPGEVIPLRASLTPPGSTKCASVTQSS